MTRRNLLNDLQALVNALDEYLRESQAAVTSGLYSGGNGVYAPIFPEHKLHAAVCAVECHFPDRKLPDDHLMPGGKSPRRAWMDLLRLSRTITGESYDPVYPLLDLQRWATTAAEPASNDKLQARDFRLRHGISPDRLDKARRDGRFTQPEQAKKIKGRWYYSVSRAKQLFPDASWDDEKAD